MFEVFGEFNSAEEINKAAAGLLAEGDHENILVLAKENGLDEEIAQAYVDGEIPYLTDVMMAAIGKIEIERENTEKDNFIEEIEEDLINYILTQCCDEVFAKAVRKKSKSLNECFRYCKTEIKKALNGKSGGLRDRVVYGFLKEYYLKEDGSDDEEGVA